MRRLIIKKECLELVSRYYLDIIKSPVLHDIYVERIEKGSVEELIFLKEELLDTLVTMKINLNKK